MHPVIRFALARTWLSVFLLTLSWHAVAQKAPDIATTQPVAPVELEKAGATPAVACAASASWVTNPNPPQEIPGGGTNFCQFYQFAWQWFFYLVSPSQADKTLRNFEVQATYPQLQAQGVNSCTNTPTTRTFFVRTDKEANPFGKMVLPKDTGQAGGGATIFDKAGNVVYYEVRFSRNQCTTPEGGNFPAGTTELKLAWRVLTDADAPRYYTIKAEIDDGKKKTPVLLGLIGFHLARSTAQHPEFVWATWEHKENTPECLVPPPPPPAGWSFANAQCAQCLKTSTTGPLGCAQCKFNVAPASPGLKGPPTQICRVYRDGSGPNDNKVTENIPVVDTLNAQLIGPAGIVSKLPPGHPMAVWRNYFNVGGLWVSDPKQPATLANQRGSLQLTSSVMETTKQGQFSLVGGKVQRGPAQNCFGCHTYSPPTPTTTSGLSHTFDDIKGGKTGGK